jgi:hypothetical protein
MRNKPYAIFLIFVWAAIMLFPLSFLVSPSEASGAESVALATVTATRVDRRLPPVTLEPTEKVSPTPPVPTIASTRVPPPTATSLPPATPTPPPPVGDAACYACHVLAAFADKKGAPSNGAPDVAALLPQAPAAVQVTTHGNNFSGKSEQPFFLGCTQCHEAHGNTGNLKSVLQYVKVRTSPVIATGPVVFTAFTSTNSFDDNLSPEINRICVTCHTDTNDPGYPMSSHLGGFNHKLKNSARFTPEPKYLYN